MQTEQRTTGHLAWHETLELHELIALQSTQLIRLKKKLPAIQEPALRTLYTEAVQDLEQNLRELLQYYPTESSEHRAVTLPDSSAEEAGQLLGFAKTAVRNYAIAITETATSQLRDTFQSHLFKAIQLHAKAFAYLYERGLYPAYDLDRLLANDVKLANFALGYAAP